jgi:magnesium chelatase subunit H
MATQISSKRETKQEKQPKNQKATPQKTTRMTMVVGMEQYNLSFLNGLGQRIGRECPGFEITVYADLDIDKKPDELKAAIAASDCFFASLINITEQANWLVEQVEAAKIPAVLVFESLPEVMELNRLGNYAIKKPGGGKSEMPKPVKALANMLVHGREEDAFYGYIKLQKFTNRLMKFMPPQLNDMKRWMTINTYWTNNNEQNVLNMLRYLAREVYNYPLAKVEGPVDLPPMSFWHPDLDRFVTKPKEFIEWEKKTGRNRARPGTVGMIFFRKHLMIGHDYITPVVRSLEKAGLRVVPVAVTGVEGHVAVREWLSEMGIDLLVNTMGFGLVGGPAGSTKPGVSVRAATELLGKLDIPYIVSAPLLVQEVNQWQQQGVNPLESLILYSVPELDGAIAPVVLGGANGQQITVLNDRAERLAQVAKGWVRLRYKTNREKKVGLLVYDYPVGMGNLATAALLDVPASLMKILQRLKAEGYNLGDEREIPKTKEELLARLEASLNRDAPGEKIAISTEYFYKWNTPEQQAKVEARWGMPPGEIAPLGRDKILLGGFRLGNVYIGVQPRLGVTGDPMRLLFDKENAPHHQYLMFYRWLQNEFGADALVHVGMHGTAEWLPGLQLGLSANCWPDTMLGEIPSLYVYPINNPSEANMAKRRGYSVIIGHAIPPFGRAGLYKEFGLLKDLLADYREGQRSPESEEAIRQKLALTHLSDDMAQLDGESFEEYSGRIWAYLGEMEQKLIMGELHTLGEAPGPEEQLALLTESLKLERNGHSLAALALTATGLLPSGSADGATPSALEYYEELSDRARHGDQSALECRAQVDQWCTRFVQQLVLSPESRVQSPESSVRSLESVSSLNDSRLWTLDSGLKTIAEELANYGRQMLAGLVSNDREVDFLLRGLSGRYIPPGIGGDLIRDGLAVLPTGRNIHSLDPWRIPSDAAWMRGQKIARALLDAHLKEHGHYPETVAQILWGLDTIKTKGESIAVCIALLGGRPYKDGQGKVGGYSLVPLAELGRPRIDVLMNSSGIFRDTFQLNIDMLDKLVRLAASADEPEELNFVKKHVREAHASGLSFDEATARIFTQPQGTHGTYVDDMVTDGAWETDNDLDGVYIRRNSYAYGGERNGANYSRTLEKLLATVERVAQQIDSVEYGLTDMQHYYSSSGALKMAAEKRSGHKVNLNYVESFTSDTKIEDVQNLLRMEYRTKLLNPKWYENMLKYDHSGAAEISMRFNHMLGWNATTGSVDNWVYDEVSQTYVLDEAMRARLEKANPQALHNMTKRLLEANGRGFWQADEEVIAQLQSLYEDLEDRLEGLV